MAKPYTPFVADVCRRLAALGDVRARSMFGGWGVYAGEAMIGLVADDVLYFKVDDQTQPYFEGAGSEPFLYQRRDAERPVRMSYWEAPEAALGDDEALCEWARLAAAAARRAQEAKPKRRAGRPGASKKKARRRAAGKRTSK